MAKAKQNSDIIDIEMVNLEQEAQNNEEIIQNEEAEKISSTEKCSCVKEKLPKISKIQQRKIVKVGLAASLAITTIAGVAKFPYSKRVHKAAGLAMVGLALLHIKQHHRPKKKQS